MEATPEVEGFIDSTQPEKKEEIVQEDEGKYKKRYDDLKKYYDQKLSEWKASLGLIKTFHRTCSRSSSTNRP